MPKPLPLSAAAGLTILYTILYIAPFYLSPTLRSTPLSSRNHPAVIRARIRAVGVTCLVCTAITILVLTSVRFDDGASSPADVARLLGVYPVHLIDVGKCLLLVGILFLGPLFEAGVVEGNWRDWLRPSFYKEVVYDDWQGWRNIVVGPASEELVFRSLAIPLFLMAGVCVSHLCPDYSLSLFSKECLYISSFLPLNIFNYHNRNKPLT